MASVPAGGRPPVPRRVLLVSQEYPPHTAWGGIATYTATLAPALARRGLEVHVLSIAPGLAPADEREGDVWVHRRPLRRIRGLGRLTGHPATLERLSLAAAVRRHAEALGPFDAIEAPDWKAEGLRLARRGRSPLIVRLHSGGADVFGWLGPLTVDRRRAAALEAAAVRAATLVTGTPTYLGEVARRLGLDSGATVALGCPVATVDELAPPNAPVVLFYGRFEHRKGPETLVRAMPAVLARVGDARLVLVGADSADGEHPSHVAWLRRLAADLGVAAHVEVRDQWAGRAELTALLRGAAVCAVPSRWESFGYTAAEAAAAGRAVVASRVPGLADVVVDGVTGRLVDPDDPAAWAATLADLLADPARAGAMGRAGRHHVRACFDPDRVAAATVDAYRVAMARHATAGGAAA